MDDDVLEVDCDEHGKRVAAIVCGHLVNCKGSPVGFIENSSEPDDLQAWCYACEHMYKQENDMTEKFKMFCDMKVVCTECYNKIKELNTVYR